MELARLLNPRAIAVIGATRHPGKIGRIVIENLLCSLRRIYAVHPREADILGCPAVARVEDLPDGIDVAVIATPAGAAVGAAHDCAVKGIPFIIVLAGGFGEAGAAGAALEARLREIPATFGSRILGPNSLGIFVPSERLDTIFVEHGDKALAGGGGVAFITQSGSVGVEALGLASNSGYGLRAFVGLGNKCDLNELDFLEHFGADDRTDCLAFYLESIAPGRVFLEAAARVSRKKPVVVLKAGCTPAGAEAVCSHTGQLAGSDRVIGGVFRQFGIQRATDDEALCDAAKCLAMLPLPRGNRLAVLTPAGGFGVMCSDYVDTLEQGTRLALARLCPETADRIRAATLPYASCSNPVDLTAMADDQMFGRSLDALLDDDGVDMIICTAFFSPPAVSDRLIDEIAARVRGAAKPIIALTQYGPFTDLYLRRMHDAGVVGFPSIYRVVRAVRFLVERAAIVGRWGN